MKKIHNPDPPVLNPQEETEDKNQLSAIPKAGNSKRRENEEKPESGANATEASNGTGESDYDLSDVGDAPLISALKSEDTSSQEKGVPATQEETPMREKADTTKEEENPTSDKVTSQQGKESPAETSGNPCKTQSPALILQLVKTTLKLLSGEMTEEELRQLSDPIYAAEAIRKAKEEGEIAGRNAIIEEKLKPKRIGAPDLCGSPAPKYGHAASIFDLARKAK